jgi:HK97 gp10 family phage protein
MIIMASKINISKLLSQIDSFGQDANRTAVAVTNETTQGMVTQAQLRVVVDLGQLRQSIGKTTARVGFNRSFFFANAPYAAYVEFGTGSGVIIPNGFSDMAAPFKGKGIRIRNYPAKPFFIPSYLEGIQQYPKTLRKVLEVQTRKYNAKK